MGEKEDEDEWFYDSMKRYKQLRMFEYANIMRHMELSDAKRICVVGKHERSGRDEIMELLLPAKVTVPEIDEGLVKDCDLKVERGGFTSSEVFQMEALRHHRKLVLSEKGQNGVAIYDLNSETSDIINRTHHLSCDHKTPYFTANSVGNILTASTTEHPLILMDINTGHTIQRNIVVPCSKQESIRSEVLEPKYFSDNIVAVCNKSSGSVNIMDMSTGQVCYTLQEAFVDHKNMSAEGVQWTLSSPSDTLSGGLCHTFSCISNNGVGFVYDLRNPKVAICSYSLSNVVGSDLLKSHRTLSLQMYSHSGTFSVSGFDENVYLYKIKSSTELENIFTHDGHKSRSSIDNVNFVSCHIWYKDDILISAAEDKSIHCWQYVYSK